jgi:hypothetical protein
MMQQASRIQPVQLFHELVLVQLVQQLRQGALLLVLVQQVLKEPRPQQELQQPLAQQALGQLQVLQIRVQLFSQQVFSLELSWQQSFSQVQQCLFRHRHRHQYQYQLSSQQLFWQGLFSWQACLPQAAHRA